MAAFCCLSMWVGIGCSTDIDLTAPYERTPVVFSLLEAAQDTQWVRINRTWLGDGNQFEAAMVQDSSEYDRDDLIVAMDERSGEQVPSDLAASGYRDRKQVN